jgi:hypothetical protein
MSKQNTINKYDIEFEKKAVAKLRDLAKYFSASESNEDLTDVILKGLKVLDIAKKFNTSTLYVKTAPNRIKTINIKDI